MANQSNAADEQPRPIGVLVITDVYYGQLRQEIVSGELPPGSKVHEVALSSRFGVSRAPVRDAIRRLESDGLVERTPRGAVVRRRSAEEIFNMYQARIALEAEAASAAARHASELDIARLTMTHQEAESLTAGDTVSVRELHSRWHRDLATASHNASIVELLGRLALQLAPFESGSLQDPANAAQTLREHSEILSAVTTGQADAARAAITAHLQRTRDVRVNGLLLDER